jgi:pimeloyl-ACP methyl ester carboxylesterase
MMRVLYLHGFASGPQSRKACFFKEQLLREGIMLKTLDLAEGNFHDLTLTSQLRVLEREAAGEPVALIGSSMGGYLAALYAARHPEVAGLVLLAPAFSFHKRWTEMLGEEALARWKRDGEMMVYHYAANRDMALSYRLMEDAERYEPYPSFTQPCLILHGTGDTVVPVEYSEKFARQHPNVQLVRLESGHELTEVLESTWAKVWPHLFGIL